MGWTLLSSAPAEAASFSERHSPAQCLSFFRDLFAPRIADSARTRGLAPLPYLSPEIVPQEAARAGFSFTHPDQLKGLGDDLYVYLIDDEGRVFISPRTLLNAKDGKTLATHRSLLGLMRDTLGKEPRIVAGGEFEMLGGRIPELNNKCGSFRPDTGRLRFAREALAMRGLPIERGTQLRDASKGELPGAHFAEAHEAESQIALLADPRSAALLAKVRSITRNASRAFPDRAPERFDLDRAIDARADLYYADAALAARSYTQQSYLPHIQDPRERYGRLRKLIDVYGIETARAEIEWIELFLAPRHSG